MTANTETENEFFHQRGKSEVFVSTVSLIDEIVENAHRYNENKESTEGNKRDGDENNMRSIKDSKKEVDEKVDNESQRHRRKTSSNSSTKRNSVEKKNKKNKRKKETMNDYGVEDDTDYAEYDVCNENDSRGKAKSTSLLKRVTNWFASDKSHEKEREKKKEKMSRSRSTSNNNVTNTRKENKSQTHRKTSRKNKQKITSDTNEDVANNNGEQVLSKLSATESNIVIHNSHKNQHDDDSQRGEEADTSNNLPQSKIPKKNVFCRRRSTSPSTANSSKIKKNITTATVNAKSTNLIIHNNNNMTQKLKQNLQNEEKLNVENSPVNIDLEEDVDEKTEGSRSPDVISDDMKENTQPYAEERKGKEELQEEELSEHLLEQHELQQQQRELVLQKADMDCSKNNNNNNNNKKEEDSAKENVNNVRDNIILEKHGDDKHEKSGPCTVNARVTDEERLAHESNFDIYEMLAEFDTDTHESIDSAQGKENEKDNKSSSSSDSVNNKSEKSGKSLHKESEVKNKNETIDSNESQTSEMNNSNETKSKKNNKTTCSKRNVANKSKEQLVMTSYETKEQLLTHKHWQQKHHGKNNAEKDEKSESSNNIDACKKENTEMPLEKSNVSLARENINKLVVNDQNNACIDMSEETSKMKRKYVQNAQIIEAVEPLQQKQSSEEEEYYCQQQQQQQQQQLCMTNAMNPNANASMLCPNYSNILSTEWNNINNFNNMSQSYIPPFLPWNGPNPQLFSMTGPFPNPLQPITGTNQYFFNAGYEVKRQYLLNQIMSARQYQQTQFLLEKEQEQHYFNILRDSQVDRRRMSKDTIQCSNNTLSKLNSDNNNTDNMESITHEEHESCEDKHERPLRKLTMLRIKT